MRAALQNQALGLMGTQLGQLRGQDQALTQALGQQQDLYRNQSLMGQKARQGYMAIGEAEQRAGMQQGVTEEQLKRQAALNA